MIKNFKNYRYICWSIDSPDKMYYCFSNSDVTAQTGINRSALYKLLNSEKINKWSKWSIIRTNIPVGSPYIKDRVNCEINKPTNN